MRSDRFDLDVPDDFPIGLLETVHAQISDPDDARRRTAEWVEWAGACNGLLYRFCACAEHADRLASSLAVSTSPPQPERFEQEKLLFNVFTEGLSALECLYYGIYFVGALVDRAEVNPDAAKHVIKPVYVTERFEEAFPTDAVTAVLRKVADDSQLRDWRSARNVLTHRTAPGRGFQSPGPTEWMGGTLDAGMFEPRRVWLASTIEAMLASFEEFIAARLN